MCTLTSTKPFEVFTKCKEHLAIKITDPPTRCPLFTFLITKRHSNFSFLTWSKKEGRHYGHIQNVSIWRSCVHSEQPSILISLLFLTLHRAEELGNKLKRKMLFLLYIPLLLPLLFLAFAPESNSFHRFTIKTVERGKINFRWKTHPMAFPSTHLLHLSSPVSLLEIQLVLRKPFFFFFPRQRRTREEKASRAALSRGDAAQQRAAFALARRLPARSCHLLPTHPERRAHLALLFQPRNSPFVQVTACENSRSASVGSVVPINKSAETTLPLRETRAAQIARDKAEWRWLYPTNSLPSCWSDPL